MEVSDLPVFSETDQENLPHLCVLDVLKFLTLHIVLQLFFALLDVLNFLEGYDNEVMFVQIWKHKLIIRVLNNSCHVPSAS